LNRTIFIISSIESLDKIFLKSRLNKKTIFSDDERNGTLATMVIFGDNPMFHLYWLCELRKRPKTKPHNIKTTPRKKSSPREEILEASEEARRTTKTRRWSWRL
jgi:hypothetical protein